MQAYERHLSVFPAPPISPAFLHSGSAKLLTTLSQAGFPASNFFGHSFRRGGATYALRCGVPVELISLQGDWSSDAVLLYIAQPLERRLAFGLAYRLLRLCFFQQTMKLCILYIAVVGLCFYYSKTDD